MEEQEIDWTDKFKKMFNMKELTLDDFLNGIEKQLNDYDILNNDKYYGKEKNFFDEVFDIKNNGFVAKDVMKKILNAIEKNKNNPIFIANLCESRMILSSIDYNIIIEDIKNLSTDEVKLNAIKRMKEKYAKTLLIETLSTDEAKLNEMKNLDEEYLKANIIETLSTDEAKIKAMQIINDETLKTDIIVTLSTDEAKLKEMENIQDEYIKASITVTLSTDEAKLKEIKTICNEDLKAKIIKSLSKDEVRLKAMQTIHSEILKADIIETLSTDEAKLKGMQTIYDLNLKFKILKKLSIDNAMLKIKDFWKEILKADEIIILSTDEEKLIKMQTIQDEGLKARIIMTLSTDEAKIKAMQTIQDEGLKERIIETLSTDETKLKEMENIQDECLKEKIIESLLKDDAKIVAIQRIQNEDLKSRIIGTLTTDEAKIKAFNDTYKIHLHLKENIKESKKIKLPPDMTIGCEIESEGEKSRVLEQIKFSNWRGKGDESLEDGVEMISPIMHSDEQSIQSIYKICDLLKQMGNNTSERCGGHIHVGASYLKDKQAYANLLSIYGNPEKLLYIIANDTKDVTSRETEYDSPLSKKMENAIKSGSINLESEQDIDSFIKSLEKVQGDRYSGLNFFSYDKHKTIEFRLPNGTINPDAWIENINLFGGIVKIAEDISIIQKKAVEDRNEDENKKMELFERQQTEGIDDKSKLEILLELVIDEEDRDIYRNRYNENIKLLTEEQKKVIENETSRKPIKSKEIGKKVFTARGKISLKEMNR